MDRETLLSITREFSFGEFQGLLSISSLLLSTVVSFYLGRAIYDAYIGPLSRIPGPKLAAVSRLPFMYKFLKGDMVKWLHKLHNEYGEVVRIAPDELSFISGETAWQDIYGFHTGEKAARGKYLKDLSFFANPQNGTWSLLQADTEAHSRMRRVLAHAFSDKALREQERLIQGYVELFIQRLHEQIENESKGVVDIVRWYNYFTFDVIADLTFGESFYCLRDSDYHPWVRMIAASVKGVALNSAVQRYPLIRIILKRFTSKEIFEKRKKFFQFCFDRVSSRLAMETSRPDFMTYTLKNGDGSKAITRAEMDSNSALFLTAGSETTATLLSGCTFLLLTHPEKLAILKDEIRGRFKASSEINVEAVNKLPYLVAVLSEALRYYPPVPAGFNRIVPGKGDFISGYWIPGGTSVAMSQWPANHSKRNFVDPDSFVPERFLSEEYFREDKKSVLNPFSFGPRNCLGKNLAYAEMRLILARLIFDFELELVGPNKYWLDQRVYTLWEKQDLMVQLKSVRDYDCT